MHTEIIESWPGFSSLKEEWNGALTRSAGNSIFLTWEWIDAWRRSGGSRMNPVIAVARTGDGQIVGIAPFYRARLRLAGLLPLRVLRILADYPTGAEYPDWILVREREVEARQALAVALARVERWDCAWMAGTASDTGAVSRVVAACQDGGMTCRTRPRVLSAVPLPGSASGFRAALSRNTRSTLQRQKNRLREAGTVEFMRCDREEDVPRYLDALVQLNTSRWQAEGLAGTFVRKPLEERFYRTFAPEALRQGWLGLFALTVNGALCAVQVGYFYGDTFFQLQEGFAPAAPAGIGNYLRARVIEHCIERGVHTYDFLGEFSEHKRRWLSERRAGADIFILRDRTSVRGRILSLFKTWPTGRVLRPVHVLES